MYQQALASWYDDAGTTACGFHATYGVANLSLPCGTKVTLRHGRHAVRVKVIDRGPFVAGREYDLTAATAQKLHFGGTGAVLTTR